MSDRERWIVYPLLFLALGSALRDKLFKVTSTKQLRCEQLVLVDTAGREQALLDGQSLNFELQGQENGYIVSNTINANSLLQRGEPVVTARQFNSQGMWLVQVLNRFFQQVQQLQGQQGVRQIPSQRQAPPAPSSTAREPAAEAVKPDGEPANAP